VEGVECALLFCHWGKRCDVEIQKLRYRSGVHLFYTVSPEWDPTS
jgi:hypothetical protein